MLSKSLTQFSVDGQDCVPSLLFDLRPNYSGGNEDNGDLLQKVPHALLLSVPPTLQQGTADPHLLCRLLDTHRQVWVGLWGHGPFLLDPGAQGSVCARQESVSPGLCKFWQLCGGANGDLLQEGLCHTQVCIQSPCPCGRPLLTCSSIGDAHTKELHELYVESSLAVTLIHRPCECA